MRWRSDLACGIVSGIAQVLGPEAMSEVTAGLLSAPGPAGWHEWLDGVEPRLAEIEEADPTLVRGLLAAAGIVTPEELTEHDAGTSR